MTSFKALPLSMVSFSPREKSGKIIVSLTFSSCAANPSDGGGSLTSRGRRRRRGERSGPVLLGACSPFCTQTSKIMITFLHFISLMLEPGECRRREKRSGENWAERPRVEVVIVKMRFSFVEGKRNG